MMGRTEEILLERMGNLEQENSNLEQQVRSLKAELEATRDGWRSPRKVQNQGTLPVPRIEFIYEELDRNWSSYLVIVQLVVITLNDEELGFPLQWTKVIPGLFKDSDPNFSLPLRASAEMAHLSGLLGARAFIIIPEREPKECNFHESHPNQYRAGLKSKQ